jgi:hypothetical protein
MSSSVRDIETITVHGCTFNVSLLYALKAHWSECQFMTWLLNNYKTADIYLYSFTIISAYKIGCIGQNFCVI